MGNIESSAKIDVTQLQGLRSRELNISRSLGYEDYKEVSNILGYIAWFIIRKIKVFLLIERDL